MPGLKNTAAIDAGWSSLVARQAHNLKVAGSNPAPATKLKTLILVFLSNIFIANLQEQVYLLNERITNKLNLNHANLTFIT